MKFNQIHILAFKIVGFAIIPFTLLLLAFYYYFDFRFNILAIFLFGVLFFLSIYFIIKKSIKNFIVEGINNIYDNSALFKDAQIDKKNIGADLETFFNQVTEFIDDKHLEIKKLHTRDDFRKEFLGNVSHELKTPIFTAQGYILTLLDNDILNDKKLQKKYLERASKSIERLNLVVKDLDMISKLESGMKLNYQTFNIIKLVSDVFEMLEIKARKRNITLTFDDTYEYPLLVEADKERIEQVLINLIANSINYGSDNGTTTVSIHSYTKKQFNIKITDDGIGIDNTNIKRLFERFYRVDKSRSRDQGGSGLGLAIVKHIIEAHNQNIFVESKLNAGSTFSFTLKRVV